MGRTIKSKVSLKEIYFDEDLYPRSSWDWKTSYIYSQSMNSGAIFPPIVLALLNHKKYLVDGKHRLEAHKNLKKSDIDAIVHTGWTKKKIFEEAIRLNVTHGRVLSPYEKRRIALKLREMDSSDKEICKLIQVPEDKLENFIGSRLINTLTGEVIDSEENERIAKEIGQAILKSGVKHFAGQTLSEEDYNNLEKNQKSFYGASQVSLLNELIRLIEGNLLDKSDEKVTQLVNKLKKIL